MNSLLLAAQFLTMLPLKIKEFSEEIMARSLVYFPVVGLFLGLMLVGLNTLLVILGIHPAVISIILVIALIIFTGGMHLDGLADTFDALLSGKNKEEMLSIMRDPHIGTMGVLAVLSVILLKISLVFSADLSAAALLLICLLSRWAMVFLAFLFPYARKEGKAGCFINNITPKIFILATLSALIFTFFIWRLKGLVVFGIITLSAYVMGRFVNQRIGGITGDVIGASSELTEIITLFSICALQYYKI